MLSTTIAPDEGKPIIESETLHGLNIQSQSIEISAFNDPNMPNNTLDESSMDDRFEISESNGTNDSSGSSNTPNEQLSSTESVCKGRTSKHHPCKLVALRDSNFCRFHQKFRFEKPLNCPICMEVLEDGVDPFSCGHYVHTKCVIKWGKELCPICKCHLNLTRRQRKSMINRKLKAEYQAFLREVFEQLDYIWLAIR